MDELLIAVKDTDVLAIGIMLLEVEVVEKEEVAELATALVRVLLDDPGVNAAMLPAKATSAMIEDCILYNVKMLL